MYFIVHTTKQYKYEKLLLDHVTEIGLVVDIGKSRLFFKLNLVFKS